LNRRTSNARVLRCCKKWTRSWYRAEFGDRGIEGKIQAIRFARENRIPYLGICLGMQLAIIEYARNVLALKGANSTEFDRATNHPVIALITEWQDLARGQQVRE